MLEITLADLPTFNDGVPDANDVEWWAAELRGWDSPDLREDTSPRGFDHGLLRGRSYYGGRPLELIGTLLGPGDDVDAIRAAKAQLIRAVDLTDTDALLTVAETPSKQVTVRRSGRVGLQQIGTHLVRFNIGLLAVDPRKYATSSTTISIGSGATVAGTVAGDADTPTVITLTPGGGGMTLTETETGQSITVSTGSAVVVNGSNRTVKVSGTLAWARLTGGTFIRLRGGDPYSFTTSGGSASVVYSAAWL